MTPLAHCIVRDLFRPLKDRSKHDYVGLTGRMADVHCFDITEALPMIDDLAAKIAEGLRIGELAFLPADKTWIEWVQTSSQRLGALLVRSADGDTADIFMAASLGSSFGSDPAKASLDLSGDVFRSTCNMIGGDWTGGHIDRSKPPQSLLRIYAALALINTPRIIGRRQHMPHRGLERRLLKQQKLLGHFPLHAWTEIKLEVTPLEDDGGAPSTEAHLTGHKALHFCRAHLRVRNGRVEIVRGHWRGDAALGIKRSRYRLTGKAT